MNSEFAANLPSPMGTLDDLVDQDDVGAITRTVFVADNFGSRTFLLHVPIKEFFDCSEVANEQSEDGEPVSQRKLNLPHSHKLAVFLLKGLINASIRRRKLKGTPVPSEYYDVLKEMGEQPYFAIPPVVCNLRTVKAQAAGIPAERVIDKETGETAGFRVRLSQKDIFWVIDGQHRRKAMQLLFEFLDQVISNHQYAKSPLYLPIDKRKDVTDAELQLWQDCLLNARSTCKIAVELHLGLDIKQERQLFHDLNNLAKRVETGLALDFDESNPVNKFVKHIVEPLLDWPMVERDANDWKVDQGGITRKDLVSINARLFLNKTNISGAKPIDVDSKAEVATKFWQAVSGIPYLGKPGAKLRTVAAQPVMMKALAKLTYDFAFGRHTKNEGALNKLFSGIPEIDFSHEQMAWRYYEMNDEERRSAGIESLASYLPADNEGVNRDIGGYDQTAKLFRFGAKHNDIYPILGDIVRWQLKLPSRNISLEDLLK